MLVRTVAMFTSLAIACGSSPGAGDPDAAPNSDAVIDVAADAGACGLRAGVRGKTTRTLEVGGLMRTYHVYLPAGDPAQPMPLVFVHHGYSMSGQLMFDLTEYAALADTEHVALVFPDGQAGPNSLGAPWDVGAGVCPAYAGPPPNAMADDLALLDAIKADVSADQCVDLEHVFVTGFSMGGYFANHAGCMRDDVRAIAPHSGGAHDLTSCVGPKPVILFHGLADPIVPAGCTDPNSLAVAGAIPAATAWAAHNGCATTRTTRSVQGGSCARYDGCPAGGQVEVCTFTAMGHCWAGGPVAQGIYACPTYASATALTWQFFKADAW